MENRRSKYAITKEEIIEKGWQGNIADSNKYMLNLFDQNRRECKKENKNFKMELANNSQCNKARSSIYIQKEAVVEACGVYGDEPILEVVAINLRLIYYRVIGTNTCLVSDNHNHMHLIDYEINGFIIPYILVKVNIVLEQNINNYRDMFRCKTEKIKDILGSVGISVQDKLDNKFFGKQMGFVIHYIVGYKERSADYFIENCSLNHLYNTWDDRIKSTNLVTKAENKNEGSKQKFLEIDTIEKIKNFIDHIKEEVDTEKELSSDRFKELRVKKGTGIAVWKVRINS